MGIFEIFKKKLPDVADDKIVSVCKGKMIKASQIDDKVFAQEIMGKTVGFIPDDEHIVAPCNGTLEVLFPTGHAFAIRRKDGTGILVHIGINTVDLNGKGFKVFAKQGDVVKAVQKIVDIDLEVIKNAGFSSTTMLIITEPVEHAAYNFTNYGDKEKAEIIA